MDWLAADSDEWFLSPVDQGSVSQLAEDFDLKSKGCGFESHRSYMYRMRDFKVEPDGFDYKGALEEAIDIIEALLTITISDDDIVREAKYFLDGEEDPK